MSLGRYFACSKKGDLSNQFGGWWWYNKKNKKKKWEKVARLQVSQKKKVSPAFLKMAIVVVF